MGGLRAGDAVLVVGATSGVGLMAIQLAKHLGACRVTGTTRRRDRIPVLRAVGADDVLVLDSDQQNNARRFDVVLDHVGGPALSAVLPLVARCGRVVQIGRLGGDHARVDLELLARNRLSLIGTTFRGRRITELARLVDAVRRHLPAFSGRSVIDSTFALADVESAFARLCSPELLGKVAVTVDEI